MTTKIVTVKFLIEELEILNNLNSIVSSLQGFRVVNSSDSKPCDILFVDTGEKSEQDLKKIESAKTSNSAKEIFLTAPRFEYDFMIQTIRLGVKEFFIQPIKKEEVETAFLKFRAGQEIIVKEPKKIKKGKIINVIGSKGGIGTTTVAVNLAVSLAESKSSPIVALMDMNRLFGEIPIFLNLNSPFNWGEVARNISRADQTYLMSILAKHNSGIYVLPSPTGIDGVNVANADVIRQILDLMTQAFDSIIIDGGQSFNETSLKILEMSDFVFLIAILSLPCLANVRKLLWTFSRLGFPKPEKTKILINRYHKRSLISLKEAEENLKQKIYCLIANDYQTTMSAINQGKHLSAIDRGAEITRNFKELAEKILELDRIPAMGRG